MNGYWVHRYQKQSSDLLNENISSQEIRTQKIYLATSKKLTDKLTELYLKILASGGADKVTRNTVYQYQRYYEMLQQSNKELDSFGTKLSASLQQSLEDMYVEASKYTGKIISANGIKSVYSNLDERAKEAANEIWSADGTTWSTKVWNNISLLKSTLEEQLVTAVATGMSVNKLTEELMHTFSVSYSSAKRLVVTEMTHIYNVASTDRMKASGIEEYEVYSAEDSKVCATCDKENHKRYPLTDKKHLPPFHPNCRCTTLAVIPNKYLTKGA